MKTLFYYSQHIPEVAAVVKKYLGSIKAGYKGLTYYPSSNNLNLKTDSTVWNTVLDSASIVNNTNASYTIYKFKCKNGVVFWVKDEGSGYKYTITASSGLYPFEEQLKILNERNKTNISLARPRTDAACRKALSDAQNDIERAIERKKGIKYWNNLGIAITHFKNWFNKRVQTLSGGTALQQSGKMVEMEFINLTSKTIKYIVLYMRPKNRVGDYYGQPIMYSAVGPISPHCKGSVSTGEIFDDELINSFETTIEIIYDDGTKKIIRNEKEWKNIKCDAEWWS